MDALAADAEDLRAQALRFIETHPKAKQPWDTKGSKIPGPQPDSADARNMLMAASGMLRKKTAGVFQAPERALSAISEGSSSTSTPPSMWRRAISWSSPCPTPART